MAVALNQARGQAATSLTTMPTHNAGDLLIAWAMSTSTTIPSIPAAGGTVPSWAAIHSSPTTRGRIAAWARASTNAMTSGTWTNAGCVVIVSLNGHNSLSPIGGNASGQGVSTSAIAFPAMTPVDTSGESFFLYIAGISGTVSWSGVPTGYLQRTAQAGSSTTPGWQVVSKNVTTTAPTFNSTASLSVTAYATSSIEIKVNRSSNQFFNAFD